MKILLVHNAYLQRGGEDTVVDAEAALLRANGHQVVDYRRNNEDIAQMTSLHAAADALWSRRTVREVQALIRQERPDVLHAHNTFPRISPSLYWAADRARLPVVQTLHNFRLLCPQAMLLRDGKVCEDCLGRAPLPAIEHACYRGSRAQSTVLSSMLLLHRSLGTWADKVDRYIALNEFCRSKFVQGGLPAERIAVKANFVSAGQPEGMTRQGLLFVGRLSAEKGVDVLARAACCLPPCTVRVIGSGPDAAQLAASKGVEMLGFSTPEVVRAAMDSAIALIFPNIWYETFGLVMVEAFAAATPVIASRLGVVPDLVVHGQTGLLVNPGDAADLAEKMAWALAHPERMAEMGRRARQVYESRYTPQANYGQLMTIYAAATAARRARASHMTA